MASNTTSSELENYFPKITGLFSLPIVGLLVASAFAVLWQRSSTAGKAALPPGPHRWPVLGNLLSLSEIAKFPWLKFTEWGHQYGKIQACYSIHGTRY